MSGRVVAAIVLAVVIALAGVYRLSRSGRAQASAALLADSVRHLRAAADSCGVRLEQAQAELRGFSVRLDSMHGEVRAYEATDPRGVPALQYRAYMEAFERYQDSSATWDARVLALREHLDECRALAAAHNELVDTLRARQAEP